MSWKYENPEMEGTIKPRGRYPMGVAAQLLGVSRKTLRLCVAAGEVAVFSDSGREKRFLGRDLIALWKLKTG